MNSTGNGTADGSILDATEWADLLGIGLNESACVYIDDSLVRFTEMRARARDEFTDPGSVVVPIVLICASGLLLVAGARLFRIAAALAAAAFGFSAVYGFMRSSASDVSCEAIILGSTLMGVLAALTAGCVYKAGLFFVGVAAMAALVHLVFAAFPALHSIGEQPTLADKSFAYWGLMLVAAVVGGMVLRHHDQAVLEVLTSCIGGAGLAYALRTVTDLARGDVPRYVFVIAGLAATASGIMTQRHIRSRGCKERRVRENRPELVGS